MQQSHTFTVQRQEWKMKWKCLKHSKEASGGTRRWITSTAAAWQTANTVGDWECVSPSLLGELQRSLRGQTLCATSCLSHRQSSTLISFCSGRETYRRCSPLDLGPVSIQNLSHSPAIFLLYPRFEIKSSDIMKGLFWKDSEKWNSKYKDEIFSLLRVFFSFKFYFCIPKLPS